MTTTQQQALAELDRAAQQCAKKDWQADRAVDRAVTAGERLALAQAKARQLGINTQQISARAQKVMAYDTDNDRVVIADRHQVDDQHVRRLWPARYSLRESIQDLVPEGMDPELVDDIVAIHVCHEQKWGGYYLNCTLTELRSQLHAHYAEPVEGGLRRAS